MVYYNLSAFQDACGYTALMKAAQVGNSPLVELLIKKGADVHKRDMLVCKITLLIDLIIMIKAWYKS